MDYKGTYSQKWTQDYVLHYYLYGTILNHFKINGLQRGTLTEMNPGFMLFIWDNSRWMGYGHTRKKIDLRLEWHGGQVVKAFNCGPKCPRFESHQLPNSQVKCFLYSSSLWETTYSLCLKGLGGKNYTLLPFNCPCAYGKIYTMRLETTNWFYKLQSSHSFYCWPIFFFPLETVILTQEMF